MCSLYKKWQYFLAITTLASAVAPTTALATAVAPTTTLATAVAMTTATEVDPTTTLATAVAPTTVTLVAPTTALATASAAVVATAFAPVVATVFALVVATASAFAFALELLQLAALGYDVSLLATQVALEVDTVDAVLSCFSLFFGGCASAAWPPTDGLLSFRVLPARLPE